MARRLIGLLLFAAFAANAQETSLEDLRERLREQERRIAELERQQGQTRDELAATADYVDSLDRPAAEAATTIGGYGELHYNNLDARDAEYDVDEIDFHRFVLFLGHRFSDRLSFFGELEVEHALTGDGEPGEVELEQAFVDIRLRDSLTAKAGLFLLPIGFINETHEPTRFYGVERNDIESVIVPSTWWEAGGGFSGSLESGLSWDATMHSGLAIPVSGDSAFRVRSGRQKVAEALNRNWAYTARVRYLGWDGLELGVSYQLQSDPSQQAGDGLDKGQLLVANLAWRSGDFALKALYGEWHFEGAAVEAAEADRQRGWYLEPAWQLNPRWGIYLRYEEVDAARPVDRFRQREAGVNYWLNPGVVLKLDYRERDLDDTGLSGRNFDGFDLGFGYHF